MKRNLWGEDVEIEIPQKCFPSKQDLAEFDELFANPIHGYFEGSQGKKLHYRKYLPKGKAPKAICIWQHGIHGQSGFGMKKSDGRYTNLALRARNMVDAGFALYAFDQLGHGFSEGHRFYIPNGDWTINVKDLDLFGKFVESQDNNKGVPLFLIGDSYGGCLCLHVAKRWQDDPAAAPVGFSGIALNAPAIIGDLPPAPVVFVLRYMLAPLFPTWTPFFMPNPVPADRIWKDDEPRQYQTSDKVQSWRLAKSGDPFCLGTALGLLLALESVREDVIPNLNVPFCVNHGTCDASVPISGTEYLISNSKTSPQDRAFNKVEGGYHDLFSQSDCMEDVLSFEINWILSRIEKK